MYIPWPGTTGQSLTLVGATMSKSLFFSFAHKKKQFARKTKERIPNPGQYCTVYTVSVQ